MRLTGRPAARLLIAPTTVVTITAFELWAMGIVTALAASRLARARQQLGSRSQRAQRTR